MFVQMICKDRNEKEMNELYDADTAKGYEPLTSEQKKEMSDDDTRKDCCDRRRW